MSFDAQYIKGLLLCLGYKEESKEVYVYNFEDFDYQISIDFKKKEINYPQGEDGIKVNEKQTCNFSQDENFVVLECVHRLLKKRIQATAY